MELETFGSYLKELRIKRNPPLTQESLAEAIGRKKMTISQFETGKNAPPQGELLDKMIKALKISSEEEERLRFLAAQTRNSIPEDIREYFFSHPSVSNAIRAAQKMDIDDSVWDNIRDYFDKE